jgi:hypothetical protein
MTGVTPCGPGNSTGLPLFQNESSDLTGGNPSSVLIAINSVTKFSASSRDNGLTWKQDGSFANNGTTTGGIAYSPTLKRLAILQSQNNAPAGSYSNDLGKTWTTSAPAANNYYRMVYCFGAFYVATTADLELSASGQAPWNATTAAGVLISTAYSPTLNMLVAGGNNGLPPRTYYSTDGSTFNLGSTTGLANNSSIYALAYDKDRGLWFAMNAAGRVYSTPDFINGPWTQLGILTVASTFNTSQFAIIPGGAGQPIVAVNGNDIYRSTDNGATFTSIVSGQTFTGIVYSNGVLIAVGSKIYRSTNNGANWTDVTGALGTPFTAIAAITP